jgi:hypothetical protein
MVLKKIAPPLQGDCRWFDPSIAHSFAIRLLHRASWMKHSVRGCSLEVEKSPAGHVTSCREQNG